MIFKVPTIKFGKCFAEFMIPIVLNNNSIVKFLDNITCNKLIKQCNINNIQLLMFEETNIKMYRCAEGDIDRREAEVSITFQTQINLKFGSSNTNYCFITRGIQYVMKSYQ